MQEQKEGATILSGTTQKIWGMTPASKGAKKCPKGRQPWLTPAGDGWELVGEPVSSLSLLDHKLTRLTLGANERD